MPKNSLDRLRYLILSRNDATAKEVGVTQKNVAPNKNELKERDYYYCYLFYNSEEVKGWRNDGFRSSWDCKSHWSYPLKGKLRRKIDKVKIDNGKDLHRWATQINLPNRVRHAADPINAVVVQNVPTLVEYFVKSKNKQVSALRSPLGANIDMQLINKLVAELEPKKPEVRVVGPSLLDPNFDSSFNSNILAMLNYEATKQLSLDHEDHLLIETTQQLLQHKPLTNPIDYLYPPPGFDYPATTTQPVLPLGYRGVDTALSPAAVSASISPFDWANWQQTLHSWAVYLDQLPPEHKAVVWTRCRSNPSFPAYSVDTFVELWHLWSQSFQQHAPAIRVFCAALDHFKEVLLIAKHLPNLQPPPSLSDTIDTSSSTTTQTQATVNLTQPQNQAAATIFQSSGTGSVDLSSNTRPQENPASLV